MTAKVDRLITKKKSFNPNLREKHIRCVCHKIALILTAGFKVLNTESKRLRKSKETLGYLPLLDSIPEDETDGNDSGAFASGEEEISDSDDNENSDNKINLNNNRELAPSLANPDSISGILTKVDFVIQRITSSSSKRSEYDVWQTKLEDQGPTLIAGYGIRWNIKWESRDCAYKGRNVISRLIENEKDRQERDGGKNFFHDHEISRGDWEVVKRLNDILSEFYFITKKMEGDHSSAGLLLVEYVSIKDFLKKRINNVAEPEFKAMLRKMIEKTETYLHEPLVCDSVILATILNPSFRLSIFQACFSSHYDYAKALLQQQYTNRKDELVANINLEEPSPPVTSQPQPTDHH
ncbi:hypothetical protein PGTUg99_010632 [Puccinia graminis f. sp. tritici]|uniref:hAT-like transposase RNase-H fold domain-containing protein n=1 Tax=Puccinia graminis f. sp. tritici TaxID=56615 RepID=A0A5B0NH06_PUCGR|nr:hypothetical protein PGTUg99_010632 [Puccinia graminis f. sp. tritici]